MNSQTNPNIQTTSAPNHSDSTILHTSSVVVATLPNRLSDLLTDESNNPQPIYSLDKIARVAHKAAQRQSINRLCANECSAVWEETLREYHIKPNSIYPNLEK